MSDQSSSSLKQKTKKKKSVLLVASPQTKRRMRRLLPPGLSETHRIVQVESFPHAMKLLRPRWMLADIELRINEQLSAHLDGPNTKGVTARFLQKKERNPRIAFYRNGKKQEVPREGLPILLVKAAQSIERNCREAPFDVVIIESALPTSVRKKSKPVEGIGFAPVTLALIAGVKSVTLWLRSDTTAKDEIFPKDGGKRVFMFTDRDIVSFEEERHLEPESRVGRFNHYLPQIIVP